MEYFLQRERELGRNDLVIPIYYVDCELQNAEIQSSDSLVRQISKRNYFDWRQLRTKGFDTQEVRGNLAELGKHIVGAIKRSNLQLTFTPTDDQLEDRVREVKTILCVTASSRNNFSC